MASMARLQVERSGFETLQSHCVVFLDETLCLSPLRNINE